MARHRNGVKGREATRMEEFALYFTNSESRSWVKEEVKGCEGRPAERRSWKKCVISALKGDGEGTWNFQRFVSGRLAASRHSDNDTSCLKLYLRGEYRVT
ncbi:hypothetical protein KM043_006313 [Ampulex compressa]|nr:hypothetical protein KM043_006313 [Ampulex compressa]